MPRKGPAPKRQILPDPKYNSKILARFINKVMLSGKKSTAEQVTYGALDIIAGPGHWQGTHVMGTNRGRRAHCTGVHWSLQYGADLARVSVPRRCLGNPKWVHRSRQRRSHPELVEGQPQSPRSRRSATIAAITAALRQAQGDKENGDRGGQVHHPQIVRGGGDRRAGLLRDAGGISDDPLAIPAVDRLDHRPIERERPRLKGLLAATGLV